MRVVLIAAQSLDGFITKHDLPGTAFTSPEDKAWFPACLEGFDSCVMGVASYRETRETLRTQLPHSTLRRIVLTHQPAEFAADAVPGKLEFSAEAPAVLVARLQNEGVRDCALLGGAETNGSFLAAGLVDDAWITLEPQVFGTGRPLAPGRHEIRWHLRDILRLGPDVLLLKYSRTAPVRDPFGVVATRIASTVLWVTLAIVATGAILGAGIFPLVGLASGSHALPGTLALRGVKELGFYFGVWAPGIGIVVATIKEWRRRHPESG